MLQDIIDYFSKSTIPKPTNPQFRFDLKRLQLEKARQLGMTEHVKVLRKELHDAWLQIAALN